MADAKVERREIECIVVGLGPGSYTGIRGAIALAQGWQLASGVKLLGVSSVEGIAAQAQAEGIHGCVDVLGGVTENKTDINVLQVFPNPASDQLTLVLSQNNSNATIKIYNLLGELKNTSIMSSQETTIDIGNFFCHFLLLFGNLG